MRRFWGVVVMGLVALIGGWMFYASSPTTGPDLVSAPEERGVERPRAPEAAPSRAVPDDEEEPGVAAAPVPAPRGLASSARIPPSSRMFESPAAAAAFVEARFMELLALVAPEVDPKEITRTCQEDGRICTFEGPWPGNDLLKNWIRAVSDGRTGPEQLDGVMFSEFAAVEVDGVKRLRVVAHAP